MKKVTVNVDGCEFDTGYYVYISGLPGDDHLVVQSGIPLEKARELQKKVLGAMQSASLGDTE
jgi:hypothetical protein